MTEKKELIEEQELEEEYDYYEVYYSYRPQENKCYLVWYDEKGEIKFKYEMIKLSENSYQTVFKHNWFGDDTPEENSRLIVEKNGKHLEFYLVNVEKPIATVYSFDFPDNWELIDWGKAVWDEKKQDYLLKKGMPKSFFVLVANYEEVGEEILFRFDFPDHLVQKDKDKHKNYIYYQFDYNSVLGQFIYDLLIPHLPSKKKSEDEMPSKEVVVMPSELGVIGSAWQGEYWVNNDYSPTLEMGKKHDPLLDISWYTHKDWIELNGDDPALVISFLPTSFINYKLPEKHKLTGTRWFKKLYELFVSHGTPLVLKCYPDFIRQMSMKYKEWYAKLNKVVELPLQIEGKMMGTGNILAFFNCPWLKDKKISFEEYYDGFYSPRIHEGLERYFEVAQKIEEGKIDEIEEEDIFEK